MWRLTLSVRWRFLLWISALVTIAMASARSAVAGAVCVAGSACYSIGLMAPGGTMFQDSGPFPVEGSVSGLDATGFASGTATAVAGFGRVGAKSETDAFPGANLGNPALTTAEANFTDQFGAKGRVRRPPRTA
jgi:hypothetical protein